MATKNTSKRTPPTPESDVTPLLPTPSDENVILPKDQMDYAMKHFVFIAEQRLKIFNFYVIVFGAFVAALVAFTTRDVPIGYSAIRWYAASTAIWGAMNLCTAVVFFIIEMRNLMLLDIARTGLQNIEAHSCWPDYLRLSTLDSQLHKKGLYSWFSYQIAFRLVYGGQFFLGVFITIGGILVLVWDLAKSS